MNAAASESSPRVGLRRHMLVEIGRGTLRFAGPAPGLSSASGPWAGFLLEQHLQGGPCAMRDVAPSHHHLIVQLQRTATLEWVDAGPARTFRLAPRESLFLPAMAPFSVRTPELGEFVAVSLEPTFLRCAAHEAFRGPDRLEWKPAAPCHDALVCSLAWALRDEAAAGYPGGRHYGETLATALAVQLVRLHAHPHPPTPARGARLSRLQLRRVVDRIQSRLADEVSLHDLALTAELSPFHFARLFKLTTGQTPHQYVIQCRLERARELLLVARRSTVDVALEVGFCDQSHLTAHFKRVFGITPKEFRAQMGSAGIMVKPQGSAHPAAHP